MRNIIIGVWCANGSITVLAVVADLVGKFYIGFNDPKAKQLV